MDPFPPKIPLEINVKRTQAAIILHISVKRRAMERLKLMSPASPQTPKMTHLFDKQADIMGQVLWFYYNLRDFHDGVL